MNLTSTILVFSIISFIILVFFIYFTILTIKKSKKKSTISPMIFLTAGVFLSTCLIFFPLYEYIYFEHDSSFFGIYKAICLSIHNSMRLFVLDGEFDTLKDFFNDNINNSLILNLISIYSASLFVLAPITVIGVGLSFFKNLTTMILYTFNTKNNFYYMSVLNEHSLILAEDILKTNKKDKQIIFLDVDDDKRDDDLIFRAKSIGTLLFKQNINELAIKKPSSKKIIKCYFISENEEKNLRDSLSFIKHYNNNDKYNHKNFQCYVFSRTADSTLLLDNIIKGNMKVRRVNESRNLILNILKNNSIFDRYIQRKNYKEINIMIVGLGQYGTELLKAICWCGQMVGYKLTINVIDKRKDLKEIIYSEAPELIEKNNLTVRGEAQYNIIFHDETDILSGKFPDIIDKFIGTTSAYLMLGSDELNIKSAIKLRELFGRLHLDKKCDIPKIYATVTNHEKTDIINEVGGLKNFKQQSYDINFIGDIRTEYSEEVVEQKDLEEKGLKCHLRWSNTVENKISDTANYNNFEYYRKSSISEVVYSELRKSLGIDLNDDPTNNDLISEYEHRRWNAYMRSEGYVFKNDRDDVAKTHPSLTIYRKLSKNEQDKDLEVLKASND